MRELRLLRQDEDSATLVLGTAEDDEQFLLHVDDMVRAAVHFDVAHARSTVTPTPPAPAAPASPVSPREIQTRVRAGETAETIADEYGVDLAKVLRFASPVLEERTRIASEARRARARGGPGEGRPVVFGDFVDRRLGSVDVAASTVRWDARRRADGEWIVRAGWTLDGDEQSAEWIFHRGTRSVTAADQRGAEVLSDRPLTPPPAPGRITLAVSSEAGPSVVAFPPMPQADTGPIPVVEDVFDQAAFEQAVFEQAVFDQAVFDRLPDPALPVAMPSAETMGDGADEFGTPPLPLSLSEPTRVRRPERRREPSRQARTKVPSWDDILLGVRPKGE